MAAALTSLLLTREAAAIAVSALSLLVGALALKLFLSWRKLPSSGRSSEERKKKMYAPVAGTVLHHILNFRRLYDFSTICACQNPTYRILSPFHSEVYTTDPANVEYILKTNFGNYGKVRVKVGLSQTEGPYLSATGFLILLLAFMYQV